MTLLIIYTCLYFILFTLVSEFVMGLKNIIKWNQLYTCYEPHAVHINFLVVCVYIYNGHVNTEYYVGGCQCRCIIFYIVKLSVFVFLNITYELQTL